jgi:FKBP-type peptidyl-prolyl cis-trans isomerase SlyD
MAMPARSLTFHFTLKETSGRLIDTSRGGEAITCTEGAGQIIDGLEAALRAMRPGEKRTGTIPPELAYGLREADLVQKVSRARLPVEVMQVGDQFQTGPDRQDPVVTVVAIEGDEVLLDANHPLAGQALHFEVELVSAAQANPGGALPESADR